MNSISLIKYIALYFLLLFLETNLVHLISLRNITPDLILIFVITISFREKRSTATLTGFFAGLIQDLFTARFFGLSALTKSIVGFAGGYFNQPHKKYSVLYYSVSMFVLIFIHEFIYQLIYSIGSEIGFFRLLFYYILPRTFYTLIIAVMAYLISNSLGWTKRAISA